MRIKCILLIAVVFLLFFHSCIRDEKGVRLVEVDLMFHYDGDKNDPTMFNQKLENVSIFMYNMSDKLTAYYTIAKKDLIQGNKTTISVGEGDYRVVCWGNTFGGTKFSDIENFSKARIQSRAYATGEPVKSDESLYYGSIHLSALSDDNTLHTIDLSGAHIDMQIVVKGYHTKVGDDTAPKIIVENLTPQYDMMGKAQNTHSEVYYPIIYYSEDKNVYVGLLQTLLFSEDNPVVIKVKNSITNEIIHSVNLKDFMEDNSIKVSDTHEAEVRLQISFGDLEILTSVPEWKIEELIPNIQ